jgi:hypothetical protein
VGNKRKGRRKKKRRVGKQKRVEGSGEEGGRGKGTEV